MVIRMIALGGALAVLLASGCGPKVPTHDGYKQSEPWKKSKRLKFDKDNEAVSDGAVSYPRQRRSRWYVVDLPSDGELKIIMDITPLPGTGKDLALGFEVLDKGFNVVTRKYPDPEPGTSLRKGKKSKKANKKSKKSSDDDDDDDDDWDDDDDDDDWDDDDDDDDGEEETEGELEWEQTLVELNAGRYFIHIYTLGRMDEAEYSLRLKFASGAARRESNFPTNVPYYEPLPVVPAFDDAPDTNCDSCSCGDARCKSECGKCNRRTVKIDCSSCDCSRSRTCARKCSKCPKDAPPDTGGEATSARVIRYVASGGGTKVTLNRGSSAGVAVGWKGRIVNSSGKTIDNGVFTVTATTSTTSTGEVGASPDSVRAAGRARLSPP